MSSISTKLSEMIEQNDDQMSEALYTHQYDHYEHLSDHQDELELLQSDLDLALETNDQDRIITLTQMITEIQN